MHQRGKTYLKNIYINQHIVRKVWKLIITDVIISLNLTTDNTMAKWKRTNTMQKIKDRATRTPLKPEVNRNDKQFLLITWYPPVTFVTNRGRRDHDRMIVGFTTTCAINVYRQQSCEFQFRSGEVYSIKHYVIKFVSDLRQVGGFHRVLRVFSTNR